MPDRPSLDARIWLLLLAVFDVIGLGTLLLQLTQPGVPLDAGLVLTRLQEPTLSDEFWFPPLAAACVFPAAGGLFGIFCLHKWALWAWASFSIVAAAFRCFLCFEIREQEAEDRNRGLLKDMIILSGFVLLSLSASQGAAKLALDIEAADITPPRAVRYRSGHTSISSTVDDELPPRRRRRHRHDEEEIEMDDIARQPFHTADRARGR